MRLFLQEPQWESKSKQIGLSWDRLTGWCDPSHWACYDYKNVVDVIDQKYLEVYDFCNIFHGFFLFYYLKLIANECLLFGASRNLNGVVLDFLRKLDKLPIFGLVQKDLTHHVTMIRMAATWLLKFMAGK